MKRDIELKVNFAHGCRYPQIYLRKKKIQEEYLEYEENNSVLQRVLEISGIHQWHREKWENVVSRKQMYL